MNTKTNVNTKKLASLLIALLMVFNVGAITVFAGNGDGTGGGNHNADLTLQNVRYETGSGYANLDGATITGNTVSGYISFDRGMTTYSANNFLLIRLLDEDDDPVSLSLAQATSDITDGSLIESKYVYTFSATGLESGTYRLALLSGIMANNGHTLMSAPIYKTFTIS